MADAGESRPRPKPRPRPKIAVPEPKLPAPSISTELIDLSSSPREQTPHEVEDEDALFMRNRGRTKNAWKKLKELDRETLRGEAASLDLDENDSSLPRCKDNQVAKGADLALRKSNSRSIQPISIELDDEEMTPDVNDTSQRRRLQKTPSKRKRERSRSKSITPPPELRIDQVQSIKDAVRQILDVAPRTPSPTILDDIDDDIDDPIALDPELARIAAAVRNQSSQSQFLADSLSGGPEVVTVKVRWLPHPLDKSGKSEVWGFKMNRNDPFRVVFEEVADLADILFDDLIICHQHNRLFPSVTPNGLKIWAQVELEACNGVTYNYIRTQRHESPITATYNEEPTRGASPSTTDPEHSTESDDEGGDDQFRLTLRSAQNTVTLKVRPTTTCGAIVKAFLKSAGLANKYPQNGKSPGPSLSLDGEKLNPADPISTADLEDGDCVDVVGL